MACAYQPSVMLALACPRRVCTVFTSTPLARSWVACVCLSSWNFSPSKPCPLRHARHQLSNVSMRYQLPVSEQHTEELNGEDTLEFECREVPTKGDRLLWLDGGVWREHVVVRTDEPLDGLCSVYAESSLCELLDDFIEEQHLVSKTARQALAVVLAPTRWTVSSCDVAGAAGCVLYHVNALWALRRVAEVWDGEVEPVITVAGGRVASRGIRFKSQLGSWKGLRFTYGKNMAGCTRTVLEQDVYTALYGFGAGLPVTDEDGRYTGGYRKKLTFGEVNGGVNWVGDENARLV